jgi:formylglycine-generating enzyme required for sulfatase activity
MYKIKIFVNNFFLILMLLLCTNAFAQEPAYLGDFKEMFKGPENMAQRDKWLSDLKKWREEKKTAMGYDSTIYAKPGLKWVNHTFIYVQMMAHDRFFYDPVTRKYTVERYLNDLKKRYGGIDAVLIWPTYPNIGVDNRNQLDLTADMPGGKTALKQMIKDFKKNGVRVFFPIMIWDHGTAKIKVTMPAALVKEMKEIGADGMNGDTMFGVSEDFYTASKNENYPLAFQPELSLKDLRSIEWNRLSWGYYWNYGFAPGVSVYKWFESQHQVNITNRWAIDKTDDLQYAFFNGIGYNAWENIWSIWNQVPDRYAESIRRIAAIYREFPDAWSNKAWEPYIPVLKKGVFSSKFPDNNQTVYTFINRDSTDVDGNEIALPYKKANKYYDLWNGKEISAKVSGGKALLSFPIEGRGFGAILVTNGIVQSKNFNSFLAGVDHFAGKKLKDYSTAWKPISQRMTPIKKTVTQAKTPEGMVEIPAVKDYNFESLGVMIEGDELPLAVGVQHPWQSHPARSQKHQLAIPSFYMDKYPVTNKQFKQFITKTAYHPADGHNFLRDWKNGTYPAGWENKPVTWVSLEDARAYANWAGKRLPHEWEWQYAAQGTDGRLYPWGNNKDADKFPPPDTSRDMRKPTDVNAYPAGASQFGVVDMVGNVWQWTDEYADLHSRTAILKGSSYFHAQTSSWYFPPALELNKYGKYLLMAPSNDRAETIGFRCVVDK